MFGFNKDKERQSTAPEAAGKTGLLARLKKGLSKTSAVLTQDLGELLSGRKAIDEDLLEEIETRLLMADVGVDATQRIVDGLRSAVDRDETSDAQALSLRLKSEMVKLLKPCERALDPSSEKKPFVILVVGVNGAGKTTTIGKLALKFKQDGKQVMLAAGDTFRAAAVEQLKVWGERNAVPVVAQQTGADSASVVFDALQAAQARGVDILIADTAGRLHTQSKLMDELKKVKRVLSKLDASAPHETLLVLDASAGQNALHQAEQFSQAVGVTGLALTKLDGTAKGGIAFAVAEKLGIPFRYIGIGEGIEDLRSFQAEMFVEALLSSE